MATGWLSEELRLHHLKLNHHNNRVFYCCQWRLPHWVFLLFRLLLAGYALYAIIIIVHGWKIYYAFTIWSYTILVAHLVLTALLSLVFFKEGRNGLLGGVATTTRFGLPLTESQEERGCVNGGYTGPETSSSSEVLASHGLFDTQPASTPFYFKISWALSTMVFVSAPIVTIVFWTILWPNLNHGKGVGIGDINVHALNFGFVILDNLMSARPVRLMHAVYAMLYGFAYLTFTIVLWSLNHDIVIYPFLNWGIPQVSVPTSTGLCFIALPVIQLCYYGLYRLKRVLFQKFYGYEV